MKRKHSVKGDREKLGSWSQIIHLTEEKLRGVRQRSTQLEDLLGLYRRLEAAGQPSPADLLEDGKGSIS